MPRLPFMSATVITITANNNNNNNNDNTGDAKFLVRRQDVTSPMFYFHLVVKHWNDSCSRFSTLYVAWLWVEPAIVTVKTTIGLLHFRIYFCCLYNQQKNQTKCTWSIKINTFFPFLINELYMILLTFKSDIEVHQHYLVFQPKCQIFKYLTISVLREVF